MPHYVIELKRPKDAYGVYSTIVDNLITAPMPGAEMKAWLEERDYTSWLKQGGDSLDELIEKFGEQVGRDIHENQKRTADWFYWNEEHGFTFGKESDAYFCLPRSSWCNN
jgi:hypothetical protein